MEEMNGNFIMQLNDTVQRFMFFSIMLGKRTDTNDTSQLGL
jgi:hypothetical protein